MALINAGFREKFPMVFLVQLSSSPWDTKSSLPHLHLPALQRIAACWAIEKVSVNNYECPFVPAIFLGFFSFLI